jgi:EAL domain-containing protein (putative c-di-GMP-specific phosphodiesterase class I)
LVQSIIEIGKNFEMKTVAEGVESLEQLKILQELGCDIIQGYFYSKPLTIDQLSTYIHKEKK